jgi:hypothetical protein
VLGDLLHFLNNKKYNNKNTMSRVRVNTINPFSGQNITLGGHAIPSGSDKTLGSENNPWSGLYISGETIYFLASPTSSFSGSLMLAQIKAGGESTVGSFGGDIIPRGQIFIEDTLPNLRGSFSVGRQNQALGTASLANGRRNTASGQFSHAEGSGSIASGVASHTEGFLTTALGNYSHAEGRSTTALGQYSHTEGLSTLAFGQYSHAEGDDTYALGSYSHAEGQFTTASGVASHAGGYSTITIGNYSTTTGYFTTASGVGSYAGGRNTKALGDYQTVVGEYNTNGDTTSHFIVGGGTSTGSLKDAFKVTHSSSIVVATQTAAPSWTGTEGEMVPFVSGSVYRLYAWLGGAWRSSSFA